MMPVTRGGTASTPQSAPPRPPRKALTDQTGAPDAPKRIRFDPAAVEKFDQASAKVLDSVKKDFDRLDSRIDTHLATLEETIKKHVDSLRVGVDRQERRSQDEYAHFLRTCEKLFQNIAAHATDLKQRDVIQDTASRVASQARALELGSSSGAGGSAATNLAAAHIAAAQVSGRQRGRLVDAEGWKLGHVPDNDFDKFSEELKQLYKHRDGVTTKAEYERKCRDRLCTNCPGDQFNMPHRELKCTLTHASQEGAEKSIGKARQVRGQQRLTENMARLMKGQTATSYAALVAMADSMDAAHAESSQQEAGYASACLFLADLLPVEVSDDTDAALFLSMADQAITAAKAFVQTFA